MAQSGSILGNTVLRKEDPGLLAGANQYIDDMKIDDVAHIVFVRSPVAHARSAPSTRGGAKAMPGVLAVYTADDLGLPDNVGFAGAPDITRPPLARGKVRFVGDIVAAVVATDPLPRRGRGRGRRRRLRRPCPRSSTSRSPSPASTLLFEEKDSNVCFATAHGADDDALEGADVVAEARILSQRLAGVPMEPNACVAIPEGDGLALLRAPPRRPTPSTPACSPTLGMEPEQVRVIGPWVGGGFGPKAGVYVEYEIARRRGGSGSGPAGEVDRDPQREHALDGARPQLHHGRQARREERRHDRRAARPRSSPTAAPTRWSASCCRCSPR